MGGVRIQAKEAAEHLVSLLRTLQHWAHHQQRAPQQEVACSLRRSSGFSVRLSGANELMSLKDLWVKLSHSSDNRAMADTLPKVMARS